MQIHLWQRMSPPAARAILTSKYFQGQSLSWWLDSVSSGRCAAISGACITADDVSGFQIHVCSCSCIMQPPSNLFVRQSSTASPLSTRVYASATLKIQLLVFEILWSSRLLSFEHVFFYSFEACFSDCSSCIFN